MATDELPRFDFEKLDVFKASIKMVAIVDEVAGSLPRGRGYMCDQLRRSANSVPLNVAEGAGEFSPAEKARFYRIAKRSATETAAQLLVVFELGLMDKEDAIQARELLHRVVAMLTRLILRVEGRLCQ